MGTKIRSGGRFFINGKDGGVANGWKIETFNAGSAGVLGSDNKSTFTDYTLGTAQTNPIILDSRGEAEVWWNGTYLIKVYDENDVLIYSMDYFGQGEDTEADSEQVPLNGSFETDTNADGTPDSWSLTPGTNGTIATDTADSAKGLTSLKFTGTDATGGGTATSDKFDVLKGDSASVSFAYISSAVDTLNKVDINWYNAADTLLSTDSVLSEGAANPTSWASFTVDITVPATAVRATLTLTGVDGTGTTTSGNTWFDNIFYKSIEEGGVLRVKTVIATTSGSSHEFSSIPAWTKKITFMLNDVSASSTGYFGLRIGTSGGIAATGYYSNNLTQLVGGTFIAPTVSASQFLLTQFVLTAAHSVNGIYTLTNIDGDTWIGSGNLGNMEAGNNENYSNAGKCVLTGTLDRASLIVSAGTFDAGAFNIICEG